MLNIPGPFENTTKYYERNIYLLTPNIMKGIYIYPPQQIMHSALDTTTGTYYFTPAPDPTEKK